MKAIKFHPRLFKTGLLVLALTSLALLSSCGMENLNFSQYQVQGIDNKATYVGTSAIAPPTNLGKPTLPDTITISFKTAPTSIPVFLNGADISDKVIIGATSATISTAGLGDLLKQGANLLLVAPLSFGPRISFVFDSAGPLIDVSKVEDNGGANNITVRADDPSTVSSIDIMPMNYQWDGATDATTGFKISTQSEAPPSVSFSQSTGNLWVSNSSVPDKPLYKITATDNNGYITTNYYLAPEQKINDVFKLRLNKEVLDNAVPLMQSKIRGMYLYAPEALAIYGKTNPALIYPSEPDNPQNPKASQVLDEMSAFWKDSAIFYSDIGAKTTDLSDCGYLNTSEYITTDMGSGKYGYAEGPYIQCTWTLGHDGQQHCVSPGWQFPTGSPAHKAGECSRIVLWRLRLFDVKNMAFTLDDSGNGLLNLNMDMLPLSPTPPDGATDALQTDLGIRNIACGARTSTFIKESDWDTTPWSGCGWWGIGCPTTTEYIYDHYCYDNGEAKFIGIGLGNLKVTADSGNPSGGVKVLITNGAMDFDLPNMELNLTGLAIGSGLDGFIGILSGVLDSIFVNIVKGVIQQNLQDFILGFDLFTQWDQTNPPKPSMQMQSQAYQTYTNADNNSTTKLEWFMQYAGFLKTVQANLAYVDNNDPDAVHDVLGSRYSINPVIRPVDSGSVIDLAINMNIINQALLSFYLSGVSHITVTNFKADGKPKLYYGPHATDSLPAQNKDLRVELIPRTPGVIEMSNGSNGSKATMYYRNAKMKIQTYNGTQWKSNFTVEVDMRIGVMMTALDHKFQIKVLGTPDLEISTISIGDGGSGYIYNKNDLHLGLSENFVKGLVQTGVNLVLNFAVPQIASKVGELDYPAVHIPETTNGMHITTEKIEANNNVHLNFGMGMETVPCTLSSESQAKVDADPNAIVFCEKQP